MNLQDINTSYSDFSKYIDVDGGMGRIGKNKKLYVMLLGKFLTDTNYDKMCEQITADDYTTASSSAHAIKGVAANLSFPELYSTSLEMEQSLKNGAFSEDLLVNMKNAFEKTTEYINLIITNIEDI